MALAPEVLAHLQSEEGKADLAAAGIVTTVPGTIDETAVVGFIEKNETLKNRFLTEGVDNFLKTKLGVETVTDEIRNAGFHSDKAVEAYKKEAVKFAFNGIKHADLLMDKIDLSKIKLGETGVTGLDDQITGLKTKYPDFFVKEVVTKTTPPGGEKNPPETDLAKLEARKEELAKSTKSQAVRAELSSIDRQINYLKTQGGN